VRPYADELAPEVLAAEHQFGGNNLVPQDFLILITICEEKA